MRKQELISVIRHHCCLTLRLCSNVTHCKLVAIIGKNREGRILIWNHGAEQIYGDTEAEVLDRTAEFLLPPGQSGEEPEILQSMATGQRLEQVEVRRKKRNEQIIDVSMTVSPIVDDAETIIGYLKANYWRPTIKRRKPSGFVRNFL